MCVRLSYHRLYKDGDQDGAPCCEAGCANTETVGTSVHTYYKLMFRDL